MAENKRVLMKSEDCFICGGDVELITKIEQPTDGSWMALDGDLVECIEDGCGARMYVSADEDGAYVAQDEDDPHNVACYKRWEAKI